MLFSTLKQMDIEFISQVPIFLIAVIIGIMWGIITQRWIHASVKGEREDG